MRKKLSSFCIDHPSTDLSAKVNEIVGFICSLANFQAQTNVEQKCSL